MQVTPQLLCEVVRESTLARATREPQTARAVDARPAERPTRTSAGEAGSRASRTSVADRTDLLGSWIGRALDVARMQQIDGAIEHLQRLDRQRREPGFRLAVVGCANSGKSRFINRLLGRELLPSGPLPLTAALTSVVSGEHEGLEVRRDRGPTEHRRLSPDAWSDLTGVDDDGRHRDVRAEVRVTLDDGWLNRLGVEIVDTPGITDSCPCRVRTTLDLVERSDAAIMLVHAQFPFSLTERRFMEQHALGWRFREMTVVVSHLDALDVKEREPVLDDIRRRVARISPDVRVVASGPLEARRGDRAIGDIRDWVERLVARARRPGWRQRRIAGQLADHLEQLARIADAALIDTAGDDSDEEATSRHLAELGRCETVWEELGNELERRRLELDRELRARLDRSRERFVQRLAGDLNRAEEPEDWWVNELPHALGAALAAQGAALEKDLVRHLRRNLSWLDQALQRRFDVRICHDLVSSADVAPPPITQPDLELANLAELRAGISAALNALAIAAGGLLGAQPGPSLSYQVDFRPLSEILVRRMRKQQLTAIRRELDPVVERALHDYGAALSDRLREIHRDVLEETRRNQERWRDAKLESLARPDRETGAACWRQAKLEVDRLRSEILSEM